jgi:ketosteroid isomerase-like protein
VNTPDVTLAVGGEIAASDHLAVLTLFARQSHSIDGGDADGWADTFTPDGVFESPTFQLTARGRAELSAFATESNTAALARGEQLRHHVTAVLLEPAGDQLRAASYLLIVATSAQGSRIDRSVRLIDTLTRTSQGWRVAHRSVIRDQ